MTAIVFSAELIGPGFDWTHSRGVREAWPWVAELTGLCPTYGFRREFVHGHTDASRANRRGTRGVWVHWELHAGRVYELKYLTSPRSGWVRRFVEVGAGGTLVDLTREQVAHYFDTK